MSQMRCKFCGGICEWRNITYDLTRAYTICLSCGVRDAQEDRDKEEEEEDDG